MNMSEFGGVLHTRISKNEPIRKQYLRQLANQRPGNDYFELKGVPRSLAYIKRFLINI